MKRLVKGKERKICGVCSGIADYLDCDVTIIRIIVLILFMCWGIGLLGYIAAALVIPEE